MSEAILLSTSRLGFRYEVVFAHICLTAVVF